MASRFASRNLHSGAASRSARPCRRRTGNTTLSRRTSWVRFSLEKISEPLEGLEDRIIGLLEDIQQNIYNKALAFRDASIRKVDTWEQFKEEIEKGGFLLCHWDGTAETEAKIQEETKATIRCIPVDSAVCLEEGKCIYTGKPSYQRVLFARSY